VSGDFGVICKGTEVDVVGHFREVVVDIFWKEINHVKEESLSHPPNMIMYVKVSQPYLRTLERAGNGIPD
jgi:hypothetical protein